MKQIYFFILLFTSLSNLHAENVFEKNYKQQGYKNLRSLKTEPLTEIYRGWDKDKDNILML